MAKVKLLEDVSQKPATRTFTDATPLLDDPEKLRAVAKDKGYLYFRQFLPPDTVLELRREMLAVIDKHGLLDRNKPFMEGFADAQAVDRIGDHEVNWFGTGVPLDVYLDVQKLESFHALAHEPKLIRLYETLFGERVLPHPRNIARVLVPSRALHPTPTHQDYIHVQGDVNTWTCWIPLGDVPPELGGLAILEESHKAGLLGVTANPGPGGLESIVCGMGYEWAAGDYKAGDIITFHSLTVHKALPNRIPGKIRLSVDLRYQPVGRPVERSALEPHLGVPGGFAWEDLYQGWTRKDLQYYWRNEDLRLVDFDESIRWQKEKIC